MIDFSNEIFNTVAVGLRSLFDGIKVIGEYVSSPTHFPTVTLDEIQNIPAHQDSARQNKYAQVQYRAQVFTNGEGKRGRARKIYGELDAIMQEMGFVCVTYTTTPATYNSEIYCITGRFNLIQEKRCNFLRDWLRKYNRI